MSEMYVKPYTFSDSVYIIILNCIQVNECNLNNCTFFDTQIVYSIQICILKKQSTLYCGIMRFDTIFIANFVQP